MRLPKLSPEQAPLSESEKKSITGDIEKCDEMLTATSNFTDGLDYTPTTLEYVSMNKEKIKAQRDKLQKILDNHSSKRVTNPSLRDKILAERRSLEPKLTEILETWKDLGVMRRDSSDWGPAYKKAIERPKYEHLLTRWKALGAMLEPDDPEFNNTDRLRKDA